MTHTASGDGSGFVHLHNHTEHSALDGLQRLESMCRTVAELGQNAVAITDHESLAGAYKFQKYALAAGVKPIIGCEFYLAIGSRFERNSEIVANDDDTMADAVEGKEKVKRYMHLTVLARNETGWKNLLALHNKAQEKEAYWYKPRIDMDLLAEHGEGLIILTGCLGGPVAGPLARAGKIDKDFHAAMRRITDTLGDRAPSDLESALTSEVKAYRELKKRAAEASGQERADIMAELAIFVPVVSKEAPADDVVATVRAFAADLPGTLQEAHDLRLHARSNLDQLIAAVGREHVFIEVMYHGIKAEAHAFRELRTLSADSGIPLVATNDCHYEKDCDSHSHDGFLAVGVKRTLDDPTRFRFNGTPDYYLKSEAEMLDVLGNISNAEAAAAWREAVSNTVKVAALCADKVIPDPTLRLPKFPIPAEFADADAYLKSLVRDGAVERFGYDKDGARVPLSQEVKDRLSTELGVISRMGFPDYFLIVQDLINWSRSDLPVEFDNPDAPRKKPILVGPGRGSAAGSLVSYCLGIVGIDPLENRLLFERFLEEGREGLPDIDVDFEKLRRAEVFAYCAYRWGAANVARIGTFGVAGTKAAIKDAARILKPSGPAPELAAQAEEAFAAGERARGGSLMKEAHIASSRRGSALLALGNKLSDLVPGGANPHSFEKLDDTGDAAGEAFRQLVEESGEDAREILKLARAFEGITKNESIHACGFVISPEPLDDLVPLRLASHAADADPSEPRVICWDGGDVEAYGFLKMDILGLMNLDIAAAAMDNIRETTGTDLTLDTIPHPGTEGDPMVTAAFDLISAGKTSGIFQMESPGMINVAQDVQPSTLTDLSAVIAAYRPGPMAANVPAIYARRKNGLEPVDYNQFSDDPTEQEWIASVLGETYGVFIFQESLMRLGTVIAGFDAGQRSTLRRAVGKKKKSEMDKVGLMLESGAEQEFFDPVTGQLISPVFSKKTAAHMFDLMKGSASYLFNASHSAAYAHLAYVTAYLKANWPVEYSAALLSVATDDDKRKTAFTSLRDDGIEVQAPDINTGKASSSPVNGVVVVGMSEIKGVGSPAKHIVAERERNGPFSSLHNLMSRVTVPAKEGQGRAKLSVSTVQALIEAGALDRFGSRLGLLVSMRAAFAGEVPPVPAMWSEVESSTRQRLRIGTSLGVHPLVSLKHVLKEWQSPVVDDYTGERMGQRLTPLSAIPDRNGAGTVTVGVVSSWEEKGYSGGRRANLTLESSTNSVRAVIWDRSLSGMRRRNQIPKIGDVIAVSAKVNVRNIEVVDEESDITTTITTKELSINEVWDVDTGNQVEMQLPENVFDFRAAYHRARTEAQKPAPKAVSPAVRTAAAPAVPSAARECEPADEPAAPSPVIRLDARRPVTSESWVAFRAKRFIELTGTVIGGERELMKRHRFAGPPSLKKGVAEAGSVFRCVANGGETLYAVFAGKETDETELLDLARSASGGSWSIIDPTHSQKGSYTWFQLNRQAASAEGDLSMAEAV